MLKGLVIMLIVFTVVAILGWGMNILGNASAKKKQQILKYYLVGYGILVIAIAINNYNFHESMDLFVILQGILGVVMILLAVFGKLVKETDQDLQK